MATRNLKFETDHFFRKFKSKTKLFKFIKDQVNDDSVDILFYLAIRKSGLLI